MALRLSPILFTALALIGITAPAANAFNASCKFTGGIGKDVMPEHSQSTHITQTGAGNNSVSITQSGGSGNSSTVIQSSGDGTTTIVQSSSGEAAPIAEKPAERLTEDGGVILFELNRGFSGVREVISIPVGETFDHANIYILADSAANIKLTDEPEDEDLVSNSLSNYQSDGRCNITISPLNKGQLLLEVTSKGIVDVKVNAYRK